MKVVQISIGRFHHFHLARQLEKAGLLEAIYTGYPRFKLKDEPGIPPSRLKTFPWLQTPFMVRGRVGLDRFTWLNKEWAWLSARSLDRYVSTKIKSPVILVGLSGGGLTSGLKTQELGGKYICDRGSTHIRFQHDILVDEYARWGLKFEDMDQRSLAQEEAEYEAADRITIPSEFAKNTFIKMGVNPGKIIKIPYGARIDRFKKLGEPDSNKFTILWVGQISIRKGFMYALEAFQKFKHPGKEFLVIGEVSPLITALLGKEDLSKVTFLGQVSNNELPIIYSKSHVFLLPSIEDGFGMVMGEAMACGCPVIASTNTGANDVIVDKQDGFIVEIRSAKAIVESLEKLADSSGLRHKMSEAALQKVKTFGGWDQYGNEFASLTRTLG